ncbi:hypothetical protein [Streptomyces sp. NPDC056190]|uniref:hypothetical protein n=1 Tax=Streptomyces sp. NPDC056190 TaxID=3345741 RepID=UPI0035DF1274
MPDVDALVALLNRLVDRGNTVAVIEHNLDVVRQADWVVDLGPDGGKYGGEVVFTGTQGDLLKSRDVRDLRDGRVPAPLLPRLAGEGLRGRRPAKAPSPHPSRHRGTVERNRHPDLWKEHRP